MVTLGDQLAEVNTALSEARKAIIIKHGDKEVERSYKMLLQEKNDLIRKIEAYGANHIEGLSTTPKKAVFGVSFG